MSARETLAEIIGGIDGDRLADATMRARDACLRAADAVIAAGWSPPAEPVTTATRQVAAVRAALTDDTVHAGGCYYRHQQGETDECRSCGAHEVEERVRTALVASDATEHDAEVVP